MRATFVGLAGSLVTLALTQRLDKPPLEVDLDYLQKGLLENLHPVHSSFRKWAAEWIPADCKLMTENSNLSATDVRTFSVTYDDVSIKPTFTFSPTSHRFKSHGSVLTTPGFCAATNTAPILSKA